MKRLSLLLILCCISTGYIQAMQPDLAAAQETIAANAAPLPGPAIAFQQMCLLRRLAPCKDSFACNVAVKAGFRHFFGMRYGQPEMSWLNHPLVQGALMVGAALEDAKPLSDGEKQSGMLEQTSLHDGFNRFVSVFVQNLIYQKAVVRLVSMLPICKQAQGLINRACDYHWAALVGVTIAEQLALMTAEKACKQLILKPIVDHAVIAIGLEVNAKPVKRLVGG
jgi:hypothetical protein